MTKKIILFSSFILLFSSCYSSKELASLKKDDLLKFNKLTIEGIYKNKIAKNIDDNTLWEVLNKNISSKNSIKKDLSNLTVKLNFIDDYTLKVNLIKKNRAIDSIKLKGKKYKNYFSIRRKLKLIPIPFIYKHVENKSLLAVNNKQELLITNGYKSNGWFMIITSTFNEVSTYKYKKH